MEEKNEVLNIDYNIYNALNLYSEDLGEEYLKTGKNPLGDNFILTEDFVSGALQNAKNKTEIMSPNFLEQDTSLIQKNFELSLNNASALLDALNGLTFEKMTTQQKKMYNQLLVSLELFIALIKLYIKKLKKEKNLLSLYQNLLALNWNYSSTLASTFTNEFDLESTVATIKHEQETIIEKHNEEIKKQAQAIIENNIKAIKQKQEAEQEATFNSTVNTPIEKQQETKTPEQKTNLFEQEIER